MIGRTAPVFLVNGNHEQAARYLLDGTPNNVAVWAQNARNAHYSQPAPDSFYTGNTEVVPYIGLLRNHYAWTWGDALFVVIDPYWGSPTCVDNPFYGGAKRTNLWDITHGDPQYQWLKATLEQSHAKYKFVFAHHVMGTGRGGIELAGLYEWGGYNSDATTWGFSTNRSSWQSPIHQLMVTNKVTIYFQGHDHIWVRQQLDGVTYQTLPEPADPNYSLFNADAFLSGDQLPNTGYTRVTVSPSNVKVDYVRTYLPADEGTGKVNGSTAFSYSISPAYSAPVASFSAAPASGGAPFPVNFTDTSTGSITTRLWDFGDGTTLSATSTNVRHTYSIPGTYTVSLAVSNVWGSNTCVQTSAVTAAPVDTVGDGIPDWWRVKYFGGDGKTASADSAATSDPDHDGVDNYHEYLADTNPMDPLSFFHLQSFSRDAGFTVRFQSSANRKYTLYYSANLTSWTALPSQTDITGSGGVDALTDPSPTGSARFYRVGVQSP